MKNFNKLPVFAFSIIIFLIGNYASSLDLNGIDSKMADMFSAYIDKNEGLTTFRSLNIPVGGRAESLGTACTALSDDICFFDYNPAVSSVLPQTEFAVFHNAWIADSAIETIATTSRNGNLGYGAQLKCFYVPFSEYNMFAEKVAASYYSETSAAFNLSYNFLAGYNFKGIAVGTTLRAAYRSMPDYTDNDSNQIISGSGKKQSAVACMTDLGLLFRFNVAKFFVDRNPNLNVGLSVNNLGAAYTGFGDAIIRDDSLPTRISLGISYRIFAPILITTEFRKPVNIFDFSASESWSAGGGVEIGITRFFSLESGFLLQGGNPRISLGSEFDVKSVQMGVCYTFDLTSSQNPINHISLSAKLKLGDKGRAKIQQLVDKYYIEGLKLYADGNLAEAVLSFDKAIDLDKRFDPAIEAKIVAKRFLEAQQTLESMQTFGKKKSKQSTQ